MAIHAGIAAGEDRADGSVRDVRGSGDLAVGESKAPGALHGALVFRVCFVLALCGPIDPLEHIAAERASGAFVPGLLGVRDRAQLGAGCDRCARGLGHPALRFAGSGGVLSSLGVQTVVGSLRDRFQHGRELRFGAVVSGASRVSFTS